MSGASHARREHFSTRSDSDRYDYSRPCSILYTITNQGERNGTRLTVKVTSLTNGRSMRC
jgi:hypothetical protein